MQGFLETDNGNPDGTAKDAIVGIQSGTNYKSKVWNDNLFNLFKFVESQGYALIDDDLSQISKASKALYSPNFIYNTSAIATQTVNDIVMGSDGVYYEADADGINADDPVGSITGKWKVAGFINSHRISTLANLRTVKIPQDVVYVTGHTDANDGAFGSLYFEWNPTSTEADNNATIIKLTGVATGRYELRYMGATNAKWFGAKGDGTNNDGGAIFDALTFAANGTFKEVYMPDGEYIISSPMPIPAGVNLSGETRSGTTLSQTDTTDDGITLAGGNIIKNITITAPVANTQTTTSGIVSSNTSDITVDNVRILYFGKGVKAEDQIWRHTYRNVRIDNPTEYGFYFNNLGVHLEVLLEQCYVRNQSIVGAAIKIAYYIYGSFGTVMNLCTSDGGKSVSRVTVGAYLELSTVTMIMCHWEGYIVSDTYAAAKGLISVHQSRLTVLGAHFHGCEPEIAGSDALFYGYSGSQTILDNVQMDTPTFTAFTDQHYLLNDGFSVNKMIVNGGYSSAIMKVTGTSGGTAKFTRDGIESKRTTDTGSFTIDVNTLDSIVFQNGAAASLTGFTGTHSDGQKIRVIHRNTNTTLVNSGGLKLQGGIDFVGVVNATQMFIYSDEIGAWSEYARIV